MPQILMLTTDSPSPHGGEGPGGEAAGGEAHAGPVEAPLVGCYARDVAQKVGRRMKEGVSAK